jgi:hypothetical protein
MRASMPPPRPERAAGEPPRWLKSLESLPVVAAVLDAVRDWWSHHPMRLVTLVANDAGKSLIRPVAQRHPIALVVAALLVGGVLARTRPWRGLVKPAIFAGLLPTIMSKVVAHVPLESWMSALSSLTSRPHHPSDQAPVPHAQEPAQAPAPPPVTTGAAVHNTDPGIGATLH